MGIMIKADAEESSVVFVALRQFDIHWLEAQQEIEKSKKKNLKKGVKLKKCKRKM